LPFTSLQDSFCITIRWLILERINRVGEQGSGFRCFPFLNATLTVLFPMSIAGPFQNLLSWKDWLAEGRVGQSRFLWSIM